MKIFTADPGSIYPNKLKSRDSAATLIESQLPGFKRHIRITSGKRCFMPSNMLAFHDQSSETDRHLTAQPIHPIYKYREYVIVPPSLL
jgi:hypothetical protein